MKKVGIVGARIYTNKLKVKEFVYNLKELIISWCW